MKKLKKNVNICNYEIYFKILNLKYRIDIKFDIRFDIEIYIIFDFKFAIKNEIDFFLIKKISKKLFIINMLKIKENKNFFFKYIFTLKQNIFLVIFQLSFSIFKYLKK